MEKKEYSYLPDGSQGCRGINIAGAKLCEKFTSYVNLLKELKKNTYVSMWFIIKT